MCGIFGVIDENCVEKTLQALRFLQYRGYDSAGIAVKGKGIEVFKCSGRVEDLQGKIPPLTAGALAIGHTRWATHGNVCDENAHPFLSNDGNFAICHNGIIENFEKLKISLQDAGYRFSSQTDSETVAHLLQENYKGNVLQATLKTANQLEGAFAVLAENAYDDCLYAIKYKSPLAVGVAKNAVYLSSDVRCLSRWAEKVAVVPDGTVVQASAKDVCFYTFDGKKLSVNFFVPDVEVNENADGDMMLKEIFEIPHCVMNAKKGYFDSGRVQLSSKQIKKLKRIYFLGCGTAYNSGLEACAVARKFLDVDVTAVIASEFVYDNFPVDGQTLAFCISQSGETADTIRAAEKVSAGGGITYAVTNTKSSTLCFVCDKVTNVFAGSEFAVASTKAYNCQLVTLTLLVADIAFLRNRLSQKELDSLWEGMDSLPAAIGEILQRKEEIHALAERVKNSSAVFFLGRALDFPTATEGSLKLKEISYIHSEAYPSGELKHGTLALMEKSVTVVVLSTSCNLAQKNISTAREIASRHADVITLSPYKGYGTQFVLPSVHRLLYGVVAVVPLQLLAYFAAKGLGRDVDKPRNLAKSVTVE